jgi:hypothetical protein
MSTSRGFSSAQDHPQDCNRNRPYRPSSPLQIYISVVPHNHHKLKQAHAHCMTKKDSTYKNPCSPCMRHLSLLTSIRQTCWPCVLQGEESNLDA